MDTCLMRVFRQVSFKFDSIWWSIAQCIKICPKLKIWASCDLSHVWVVKSIWIGLKFGIHALDLWYDMLYKFHKNLIRDASVLEWVLSAIVQQFSACSSGGRFEIWKQSKSQMKLKFLQMLDDLVRHISTKFHGIWICTLGNMNFSLKGIESARKVIIIRLI
jgi:hypothetical protein